MTEAAKTSLTQATDHFRRPYIAPTLTVHEDEETALNFGVGGDNGTAEDNYSGFV
jgi:hypothetical protein